MKNQILSLINKKNANHDNSKVLFSELLKQLDCTIDELAMCINGAQDARINIRIDYDVE